MKEFLAALVNRRKLCIWLGHLRCPWLFLSKEKNWWPTCFTSCNSNMMWVVKNKSDANDKCVCVT